MRSRKGLIWLLLVAVVLVWAGGMAFAQDSEATPADEATRQRAAQYSGSPSPPTNLQRISDGHWTPYAPPAEAPEGLETYVIQQGDTLSSIARERLGDPYLWPQIWDQNTYIQDAHWIYPGDPLYIGAAPMVISEEMPLETPEPIMEEPEEEEEMVMDQLIIEEEAKAPPIYAKDLECTGFVARGYVHPRLRIISSYERAKESLAENDVVYLSGGSRDGIQVGDRFFIVHKGQMVSHPTTGSDIGTYVQRIGQLRVIVIQETRCLARITKACDEIVYGDAVMAYRHFPVPWDITPSETIPLYIEDSGKPKGRVIWTEDRLDGVGTNSIAYVNLGANHRLLPGDKIWVYRFTETEDTLVASSRDLFREQKIDVGTRDLFRNDFDYDDSAHGDDRYPAEAAYSDDASWSGSDSRGGDSRYPSEMHEMEMHGSRMLNVLGEAVILTTEANTACIKFLLSRKEIRIGDRVQIQ